MLLYNNSWSANCYKVRLLLTQLGIAFETRDLDVVDRSNRPEVLGGLNPALRVPTLVFDDGRSLGESGAILWYFASTVGTRYLPEDPFERAQVLQWMFFEQYDIEPNIAVARFWKLAGLEKPASEVEAKLAGGQRALAAIEAWLSGGRQFLVADHYTIADIAVYGYTHVAEQGGFSLDAYPLLQAWHARVAAQPGYIPIT
ncbi:MAG TPA: glutathione S-transferase family protein [Solirubrobacteraceae bacterium]|jgi:glutathione S-transferase|nr:glutathione S-transferase family protein [Solirubrobacteraceae bacterium]